MNTTIKKRIEEINSGRVPEGYKMTLVGIAPEEWKENVLADFFEFKNGLNKEKSAFGQGTPIINYTDVWGKRGLYSKDIKGKVSLSKKEIENYGVKKGDVFFTRTSETKQEIGLSSVLLEDVENCVFSGFVLRARPKNMEIIDVYNQYCYSSELMRYEIIKNSSITTRALTNGTLLGKVHINLPTIKEQSRIAEILMQWDKAIELQEKLIKSYQNLKKYYLSKMFPKKGSLYPEIRFAGFTEPWEQCSFKDLYETAAEGGTPNTNIPAYYYKGNIPFVKIEDTEKKYIDDVVSYITDEGLTHSSAWLVPSNSVIFTNGATIGNVAINRIPVTTKQGILGIIPQSGIITEFLYYLMSSAQFQKEVIKRQATGTFATIILRNMNEIPVQVSIVAEQMQISDFLSNIDNLINRYQNKLDKLIKQRKALQQYLLTGIVRV